MKNKYINTQKIAEWFLSVYRKKEYRVHLPDTLKTDMEALSGNVMDTIMIHYNIPKQAFISTISLN